jgi:hypothetical protein
VCVCVGGGSGGVAPPSLICTVDGDAMVSFTHRPLYSRRKSPFLLGGSQSRRGRCREENIGCPIHGMYLPSCVYGHSQAGRWHVKNCVDNLLQWHIDVFLNSPFCTYVCPCRVALCAQYAVIPHCHLCPYKNRCVCDALCPVCLMPSKISLSMCRNVMAGLCDKTV